MCWGCLRWAKSVWDDEVTQQTIANCFKKAEFYKKLCESQSSTEIADGQNESLKNLFDHLSDRRSIGSDEKKSEA